MSLLELNIKAKKTVVVPPVKPQPAAAPGTLVLEVGKTYLTNEGEKVLMCEPDGFVSKQKGYLKGSLGGHFAHVWHPNGVYVGFPPEYKRSIKREWISEMHDAWLAGTPIEGLGTFGWFNLYSYQIIADNFGPDSKTTRDWWRKNYAKLELRIKPIGEQA